MAYNREGYAPWSLTRKAGVQSATVDGDIEVPQYIQPILDTGFVDFKGDWKGRTSSDEQFHSFQKDEAVGNGGEILAPTGVTGKPWPLDMTGFSDLFIAIRPTNAGNYAIEAVMGPATYAFANLKDVDAAAGLRGAFESRAGDKSFYELLDDTAESLTANVWNILIIQNRLVNQKLLQFKITNNSGGDSDIETAFMRLV
jgi:hypothetical protein